MFESIGLTVSGLIFTLIITIVFFMKKQYTNLETSIFKILLILTDILLSLEIICTYTISIRNTIPTINEFLCRLYILGGIAWIFTIIFYTLSFRKGDKYANNFEFLGSKPILTLIIIGSILFFISCFLPIDYVSGLNNELYVIGGEVTYIYYIIFLLVGIYIVYLILNGKYKFKSFKQMPIFIFLILYLVITIIKIFYTDLNDFTFIMSIYVIIMYFTLENQDYRLAEELDKTKSVAEKLDKEKTEFLSRMSHEIRTPMNTIMGFSEALINDSSLTKDKVNSDVKNIYDSSNNLMEIINNILDVSKIDSGNEKVDNYEYKIEDIIFELNNFVNDKIDKNKVQFIIDIEPNTPVKLLGDKIKINKILYNILSNSIKFTKSGEIKLKISNNITDNIDELLFEISDTGIGIKEEDYNKLFGKFSKLNTDNEKDIRGTGLGLLITKKLSDLLGGIITLKSRVNEGTTFYFRIKQSIVDNEGIGNINYNISDIKRQIYSDKNILVVDDNSLNLTIMKKLLDPYKINVFFAKSGEECIEKIKSNENFDLIFLDYLMPNMNGIETINMLKKLNISLPPIIAISANIESNSKYLDNGFDDCISKPVDYKLLNKLLIKYFDKRGL